jgi:transposase
MSNTKQDIEDKKYLAKILYTTEHLEGKIVAQRVGVSEKTISRWVTDGNWKSLRNRLLISKDNQINLLYEQLENLNKSINESEDGYANTKTADILIKYTAAIRNLETDLAIADLVESGLRFIRYLQKVATHEQVMEISDIWNSFIQASIRK